MSANVLVLLAALSCQQTPTLDKTTFDQINTIRQAAGLETVVLDPVLCKGCTAHAQYLAKYIDHPTTKKNGGGDEDPSLPGYTKEGQAAAKNCFFNFGSVPMTGNQLVSRFYLRMAILDPNLRRIGIGNARDKRNVWYSVLDIYQRFDSDPASSPPVDGPKVAERLNAFRKNAGLEPVVWDAELSRGCAAHAAYLARNYGHPSTLGLGAHTEDPKLPGYSEEGLQAAKASVVGYEHPFDTVEGLMATFFHRLPLLDRHAKRFGFGAVGDAKAGWVSVLRMEPGKGADDAPVLYPIDQQKDVPLAFLGLEAPDPLPEAKGERNTGYPITVTFPGNRPVAKVTATLTDDKGKQLPAYLSTPEKPAQTAAAQADTICLIAKQPFRVNTTYTVAVSADVAGKPWKKSWSFTTTRRDANPIIGRAAPVFYPFPQQKNVPLAKTQEFPDPTPESKDKKAGFPITVCFRKYGSVKNVTATLTDGAGKEVPFWLSSPEKPANPHPGSQQNTVGLIPKLPLKANTTYTVTLNAQVGGEPWTETWSFTTVKK